jgi:hypothetical protein
MLAWAACSFRVGDTVRFGQSTRMYVLTGPSELMPAEGLNKQQKKQLALLEAAQVSSIPQGMLQPPHHAESHLALFEQHCRTAPVIYRQCSIQLQPGQHSCVWQTASWLPCCSEPVTTHVVWQSSWLPYTVQRKDCW